jgi:hypothetical protein
MRDVEPSFRALMRLNCHWARPFLFEYVPTADGYADTTSRFILNPGSCPFASFLGW